VSELIAELRAREVLDCKCRPTVEVEVVTSGGHRGLGAAPTGESVGKQESCVLRDGVPHRYSGMGVRRAVANVEDVIRPALLGLPVADQAGVDAVMIELDGTADKSHLGGNAIYSVSVAVLRAAAAAAGVPTYRHIAEEPLATVPVPTFNVINGGRYPGVVQPFNEFLIVPHGADDIQEAVEMGVRTYSALRGVLSAYLGAPPLIGKSYGYVAPSAEPRIVLGLVRDAVEAAGYGGRMSFALDCASSAMYDADTDTYLLHNERVPRSALIDEIAALSAEFDLLFVEDLFDENDWHGHEEAVAQLNRTLILGDDLIVSNRCRLELALRRTAVDGFIFKPNQVGTITEALETFHYATTHGLLAIPSGRSGGVVGDIVMDLAVGLQAPFQKNGAPRSGERIEKLNFLLRAADSIEACRLSELTALARY
jgi:enolase